MPWKQWAFLEQVSSAQFQDYLQNQTVCRFTSVAQRDSQLPLPTAGQVCLLTTTGELLVYYGISVGWRPPWNTAWGTIDYKQITTPLHNVTSIVDVPGFTITWPAVTGRRYETVFCGAAYSSVGGDFIGLFITDGSNAIKQTGYIYSVTNALGSHVQCSLVETGLVGTISRKGRAGRGSGTGNCSVQGSAGEPTYFTVRDVGPALAPALLAREGEEEATPLPAEEEEEAEAKE